MGSERERAAGEPQRAGGLAALPRFVRENPPALYLPITLLSTWQYAMVKIWNHFCATPAANLYLSEGAVCLVAAVLLAMPLASRSLAVLRKTPVSYALAACFCVFPLAVVLRGPLPGSDVVMGALGAASLAWYYLRCGRLYAGIGFGRATVCIFVSLIFSHLVKIALFLLPDLVVYPLLCLVPLLFEPVFRAASAGRSRILEAEPQAPARVGRRTSKSFLAALSLEVVAFSMVAGFFGTPLLVGYSWLHSLMLIGIMLVTLSILVARGPEVRISQLFEVVLLCCLLVFVVLSFTSSQSALGLLVVNVPHSIVSAMLWLLLVDVENRREFPAMAVFMAGWGLSNLASGIGRSLSAYVVPSNDLPTNFMIVLAFFLVASVVIVFNKFTSYDGFSSYAKAGEGERAHIDYSEIDGRCIALGEREGLTKREIEIVQLVAKGRSRGYIASSLVISENTVKGHLRNAYGKLGIHSKQELLSLIEAL